MNLMIMSIFYKALEFCRLFKPTRHMAQNFIYIIFGTFHYFVILGIMIFGVAMIEFLNKPVTPNEPKKYEYFFDVFMETYRIIFGENIDINESTPFQILLYILFTLLINIVNMNLLIAIISMQLEDLLASQAARDLSTQIDIFISFNCFLHTFKSFYNCISCKASWKKPTPGAINDDAKYIHYMSTDIVEEDEISSDKEFEGRVKLMMKKQENILYSIKGLKNLLFKNSAIIEKKILRLSSDVKTM